MGNGPSKKKDGAGSSSHAPTSSSSSTPVMLPAPSPHPPPTRKLSAKRESASTVSNPSSTSISSPPHDEKPPARSESVSTSHSRSDSSDKGGFSQKKLDEFFDKYKDEDGQQIGPEGMVRLCQDLGVEPDDIVMLVFAWYLHAQRMAYFSKEEFSGLQKLGVDSLAKLKTQLTNFRKDLDDAAKFKEIYRYAFVYSKEKEQKIIDLATADALIGLVLANKPHSETLRQYLKEQTTYKSLNQDQWMNILEFSKSIKADLSNYDENSAWPVILDEYSEWAKRHPPASPS